MYYTFFFCALIESWFFVVLLELFWGWRGDGCRAVSE